MQAIAVLIKVRQNNFIKFFKVNEIAFCILKCFSLMKIKKNNNMDKTELYEKLVSILPVKRSTNQSYQELINEKLDIFLDGVKNIDIEKDDIRWIEQISLDVKKIIELLCIGRNAIAFQALYKMLDESGERLIHLMSMRITNTTGDKTRYFKIRKFDNRRNVKFTEMFHIPFDKRGIVATQRYSIPGYPCLYLGESIYGCWEELGRLNFDSFMISRFEMTTHLLFIDLTIPKRKCIESDSINPFLSMLIRFPFILACMVQVKDERDEFKPEYLFPQLLMQYIIEKYHCSKDKTSLSNIKGIYYTSVYKNNEFDYPDYVFNNYAIPTFETTKGTNYCPILCNFFKLTDPTCEEYERIRTSGVSNLRWNDNRTDYEKSSFGLVEHALKDEKRFPLHEMIPN